MRYFLFVLALAVAMLAPAAEALAQATRTGPGARPEILNAIPPNSDYPPPPPTTHLLKGEIGDLRSSLKKKGLISCSMIGLSSRVIFQAVHVKLRYSPARLPWKLIWTGARSSIFRTSQPQSLLCSVMAGGSQQMRCRTEWSTLSRSMAGAVTLSCILFISMHKRNGYVEGSF